MIGSSRLRQNEGRDVEETSISHMSIRFLKRQVASVQQMSKDFLIEFLKLSEIEPSEVMDDMMDTNDKELPEEAHGSHK